MSNATSDLRSLPFDQYSRQMLTQLLVQSCFRPRLKGLHKRLKIVDIGGHKGHTQDFLAKDDVTILDVYDETYPDYVKGDGTNLDFADNQFDVAVSFDTFEHIPAPQRDAFVREAVRVAKYGCIMTAPFDAGHGTVPYAEAAADKVYQAVKGEEHPWLKEHLAYGTPTLPALERCVAEAGWHLAMLPTNNLALWLITQDLMFNAAGFPADIAEVVDVSRFYNDHLAALEAVPGTPYRYVAVISTDKTITDAATAFFEELRSPHADTDNTLTDYLTAVAMAYGTMLTRLHKDVAYLQARETHLQNEYDKLAAEHQASQQPPAQD